MNQIRNIAGYKFITLEQPIDLREQFKKVCTRQNLKGTILLAPEGINIMLAGDDADITSFIDWLKNDNRFADMEFKNSYSDIVPFKKLFIKIKKEVIAFGVPEIVPEKFTAPRVEAKQLKQWLDEHKDLVILDTRNRFEIEAGKFANAIDLDIDHFRHFPQAAKELSPQLKQKVIVTYCTGGIRCEKAAAYLMQLGFQQVYQLEGGILKYFEECGGAHYQGQCFVFDDRIALDEKLQTWASPS